MNAYEDTLLFCLAAGVLVLMGYGIHSGYDVSLEHSDSKILLTNKK